MLCRVADFLFQLFQYKFNHLNLVRGLRGFVSSETNCRPILENVGHYPVNKFVYQQF